ncbi:MAG TPA: sialate O-acetylesterase [Polyangia bacterium]
MSILRPARLSCLLAFSLLSACGLEPGGGPSKANMGMPSGTSSGESGGAGGTNTSSGGSNGGSSSGAGGASSGRAGAGGAASGAGGTSGAGTGGAANPTMPGGRGGMGGGNDAGTGASDEGAPPANPGAGVMINGMMRAKNEVIVFLHIGHSNMAGRASGPANLRSFNYDTHPQLWSYAAAGFAPAKEPLSADMMTAGRAGPGMSILRAANAAAPNLFMVSIGHGHSGTQGGFCSSYRRGGLLYDIVMKPAQALKGKVTFGAIFTMLGITEVDAPATIPNFATCMQAVAAEMRADLGEPELPFMMGDWEVGSTDRFVPTGPHAMAIMPQLKTAAAAIPRAALIPTEGLEMADGHHYSFAGHKLWAERGFAILKEKGWMPWAAP